MEQRKTTSTHDRRMASVKRTDSSQPDKPFVYQYALRRKRIRLGIEAVGAAL